MHPEAESRFRRYQDTYLIKGVIHAFRLASRILPLWFMKIAAIFIIPVFIVFNPDNFRAVIKNLSCIRPDDTIIKRIFSAYKVFLNYSFYLIDLFYMSHNHERIKNYRIEVKGEEYLQEMLSMGQGFILLTLHMGNWEIGGAILSAKGVTPHIVYSPDSESTIESQRVALRGFFKMNDVPLGKGDFPPLRLLNILRDGGVVAFQGDRLFGDSGVEIDFFGKRALFPKGPVALAMVSKVPIIPVFTIMKGCNQYELFIEKPHMVNLYSSREETIKKSLEDLVKTFEKYVFLYPEQWYTFMPFWADDKDDKKETKP